MMSPMNGNVSKVKVALTRAYNKKVTAYVYSAASGIKTLIRQCRIFLRTKLVPLVYR